MGQKRYLLLEIWFAMHEAGHACATSLLHQNVVKHSSTPLRTTAYDMLQYQQQNGRKMQGDRGFWIEAKAGGLLQGVGTDVSL